jgi:hypothetical protein
MKKGRPSGAPFYFATGETRKSISLLWFSHGKSLDLHAQIAILKRTSLEHRLLPFARHPVAPAPLTGESLMDTPKSLWPLLLASAVLTAACSDPNSSVTPTAPSALNAAALNSDAGSADAVSSATGGKGNNGGGNSNGGKPDNPGNGGGKPDKPGNGNQPTLPSGPQPPTNTSPTAPGLNKVELEGLISAKSGDSLTVSGQTVVVPTTCVIRHGSTTFQLADLNVGDRVHVRASRITTGTGSTATTTLEATEIKLQNPGDGDGEDPPLTF